MGQYNPGFVVPGVLAHLFKDLLIYAWCLLSLCDACFGCYRLGITLHGTGHGHSHGLGGGHGHSHDQTPLVPDTEKAAHYGATEDNDSHGM